MYSRWINWMEKGSGAFGYRKRNKANDVPAFPVSGTYRGNGDGGVEMELRVDVDRVDADRDVLNAVSGDVKQNGKVYAFIFTEVSFADNVIEGVGEYCDTATSADDEEDDGSDAKLRVVLTVQSGSCHAEVDITCEDGAQISVQCTRHSLFFRQVKLDVDFCQDALVLPSFNPHSITDCPEDLDNKELTLQSVFGNAGVEIVIDKQDSCHVEDPDPDDPWSTDELFEVMESQSDKDPNKWNVWLLLASRFRNPRVSGMMFDKKARSGCVIFLQHSWFKDAFNGNQTALRRLFHTVVHELGHAFNLKHCFEDDKPDSLTFMNYDWRFNDRQGPGRYFSEFKYTFDNDELMFLRHGRSSWVRPGASAWAVDVPNKSTPGDDDKDEDSAKLKLVIKLGKDKFVRCEPVTLEVQLSNLDPKAPLLLDCRLDADSHNVRYFIESDSDGQMREAHSVSAAISSPEMQLLEPAGDEEKRDRRSEGITLFYSKDGFYFAEPGTYTIKAIYLSGEFYVAADPVSITIEDIDAAVADKVLTDAMGTLVAIGGSLLPRYQDCYLTLHELKTTYPEWVYKLIALTAFPGVMTMVRTSVSRSGRSAKIETTKLDGGEVVSDTSDVTESLQQANERNGALISSFVIKRATQLHKLGKSSDAEAEVQNLVAFLKSKNAKPSVIARIQHLWEQEKGEDSYAQLRTTEILQLRLKTILEWQPDEDFDDDEDEQEETGLGHTTEFSDFDTEHMKASNDVISLLFAKGDDSQDCLTVFEFAEYLMRSRCFNVTLVQYALGIFITHHVTARSAGVRLPEITEDSEMDSSTYAMAKPVGPPQEHWMDYWRNDADFVFHHRHWHGVYRAHGLPGKTSADHLDRQGELFWYMHSQMLARYDADRESWGLDPVAPYDYQETEPLGCDVGEEFHRHRNNRRIKPRPPGKKWSRSNISKFTRWENAYKRAIQRGFLDGVEGFRPISLQEEEDPKNPRYEGRFGSLNWVGHVIESTSNTFFDNYGSLHNYGHGVFGRLGQRRGMKSYMSSTTTAVRDMIFFRWHKRIDNLVSLFTELRVTDVSKDAPPVAVAQNDILVLRSKAPANFGAFSGNRWDRSSSEFRSDVIETELDKPKKRFEWGKMSHSGFLYNIRLMRNDSGAEELGVTLRIFICPKSRATDRRRWIEMDKFRYVFSAGQQAAVITRPDKHSSVIRRFPNEATDDLELPMARTVSGFCECGWPYSMLMPRGTAAGEEYVVMLCVTDNAIDVKNVRTSCGSLSYCGARDTKYPDRRTMGYPFSTRMVIGDVEVDPMEAAAKLSHLATSSFVIRNRDVRFGAPPPPAPPPRPAEQEPEPEPAVPEPAAPDMAVAWTGWRALRFSGESAYRKSSWSGRFRILIDDRAVRKFNTVTRDRGVKLVFKGGDGYSYEVKDVSFAQRSRRRGKTLNVITSRLSKPADVTVDGKASFEVPSRGVVETDKFKFHIQRRRDYFVTFTLEQPGCYMRAANRSVGAVAYRIAAPSGDATESLNWSDRSVRSQISHRVASVYCLESVVVDQ